MADGPRKSRQARASLVKLGFCVFSFVLVPLVCVAFFLCSVVALLCCGLSCFRCFV